MRTMYFSSVGFEYTTVQCSMCQAWGQGLKFQKFDGNVVRSCRSCRLSSRWNDKHRLEKKKAKTAREAAGLPEPELPARIAPKIMGFGKLGRMEYETIGRFEYYARKINETKGRRDFVMATVADRRLSKMGKEYGTVITMGD
ncbi:MAG: hypothetical protein M1814_004970 [Vezdaea aestivalis]|nr:MAG: hypothetical protein M1814_004970 [Vezdaea aestivalis]